jgi:hypothetical protein
MRSFRVGGHNAAQSVCWHGIRVLHKRRRVPMVRADLSCNVAHVYRHARCVTAASPRQSLEVEMQGSALRLTRPGKTCSVSSETLAGLTTGTNGSRRWADSVLAKIAHGADPHRPQTIVAGSVDRSGGSTQGGGSAALAVLRLPPADFVACRPDHTQRLYARCWRPQPRSHRRFAIALADDLPLSLLPGSLIYGG